ncbi:dihydropyrimidine dehydrogenase subunit A [Skermanella stibiiresistens SB22]|uniref:dihydrouracil dehydrogenase (NAD(+)) n=2 Tax=Skermanella TaxID=204447 RepID=W9H590_9PROT|nr:NAD(P)-dependent oxidoreductase [Skermanella stibiiresistens]EWY38928.1 dihydropyrimidine dehydrogenase subunit A [Skermanella stibiiresistens SB22]
MDVPADIASGRLPLRDYETNFEDATPPLSRKQALIEAARCYYCYDAPCMEACPTGIDIPSFIARIAADNVKGSATTILEANIMGGTCARVCPTEILCEQACVRTAQEQKPVTIGSLQRYATDWLFERGIQPFTRAEPTGRKIAVVGAGPAGLSCAHGLAVLGHEVTVFEARPKPGGLNEYGIAAYKLTNDFAQREVDFILSVGGITIEHGKALGRDIHLAELRADYDAVFLGLGHNAVNALMIEGEGLEGVVNAVDFIAELRQAADKSTLPIGRRIVVIGGGNTAVDAAIQSKRLGAEDVTIVYRRGPDGMSATHMEQEWAQTSGVRIKHWAQPRQVIAMDGRVREVEFEYTMLNEEGRLTGTGEFFRVPADMVFKAIGQCFVPASIGAGELNGVLEFRPDGRFAVNEDRQTSLPNVFAGGDCVAGIDLTVSAVQDGKLAAAAIHRQLSAS